MPSKPIIAAIAVAGAGIVSNDAEATFMYSVNGDVPCLSSFCDNPTDVFSVDGTLSVEEADPNNFSLWSWNISVDAPAFAPNGATTYSLTPGNSNLVDSFVSVTATATEITFAGTLFGEGLFTIISDNAGPIAGLWELNLSSPISEIRTATLPQSLSTTAAQGRSNFAATTISFSRAEVPIAGTLPLIGLGLFGGGLVSNRRRRHKGPGHR